MSEQKYHYCKIFTNAPDVETVTGLLAPALGNPFDSYNETHFFDLSIEVRRNPDVDATRNDDFLFWPVLVELEAEEEGNPSTMTQTVTSILETLWEDHYSAVAACDFEDELPWAGGIRRPESN